MSFPVSPRVVYGITPLVQVICQVRFPPILAIGSPEGPAAYQDRIRHTYPGYDRQDEVSEEATWIAQRIGVSSKKSTVAHLFRTEDGNREIHLANDSLSLLESNYDRWESFFASFVEAREALEEIYKPSFYSRIGLRYANLIYRNDLGLDDVGWSELINTRLAGIFSDADIGPSVAELSSQALISLDHGDKVRLRHGLGRHTEGTTFGYMIDADFFTTDKKGVAGVTDKLETFNRIAGQLFRWAIRDRLHQALKPQSA